MTATPIVGRGLACALGLDLAESVAALRAGARPPGRRLLPGAMGGEFPYYKIPLDDQDWYGRARALVTGVAAEAGVRAGCRGALFIATSSFDVGAVEAGAEGAAVGDYRSFADRVAGWLDWAGPVHAVSTACTSSLNALIAAQALLRAGAVDEALVLGESVAAVRLAARDEAAWRLRGGANVVDGSNPTGASASALAAMYARVLAAAVWRAGEVDLVKVQAAGSPGNDAVEAQALCAAFAPLPTLVSLKSVIGHTMGASGAAEIALLTACLDQGAWPSPIDQTDPGLGVALATAVPPAARRVLATILGFGGSHATVALERT